MKTLLWAAAAFGAAALVVTAARRGAGGIFTGDHERVAGVQQWYGVEAGQRAAVSEAVIAHNWQQLDAAFKTQPDFWV